MAKRRKSERANKLFFSFDIYNSHAWTVLPLQTICSLPTRINIHSLPLSCSRTTHASLSTFCPLHQLASSLGHMNAFCELTPIKGVFAPWFTKFGLVFFQCFLAVLSCELQTKPSFLWGNFRTRNVVWTFMDKGTFMFPLLLPLNH